MYLNVQKWTSVKLDLFRGCLARDRKSPERGNVANVVGMYVCIPGIGRNDWDNLNDWEGWLRMTRDGWNEWDNWDEKGWLWRTGMTANDQGWLGWPCIAGMTGMIAMKRDDWDDWDEKDDWHDKDDWDEWDDLRCLGVTGMTSMTDVAMGWLVWLMSLGCLWLGSLGWLRMTEDDWGWLRMTKDDVRLWGWQGMTGMIGMFEKNAMTGISKDDWDD